MAFEANDETNVGMLTQQLISEKVSGADYLQALIELDQSTAEHADARAILQQLDDKDVRLKILSDGEVVEASYWLARGLFSFHVGQYEAVFNEDYEEALKYFKVALQSAEQAGIEEDVAYTQATISYLKGDVPALHQIVEQDRCGRNQSVAVKLLSALEAGQTDYRAAYSTE